MNDRTPPSHSPSLWRGRLSASLGAVLLPVLVAAQAALAQDARPPVASSAAPTAREKAQSSRLTAELMLEILLGELNQLQGEPGVGYSLLLDAARRTGDARLYQRAVDIALQSRSGDAALEAANAWKLALPQSREANRHVLQILLALNRVTDTLAPLKTEIQLAPPDERAQALTNIPGLYARISDKKLAAQVVEQAVAPYQARPDTAALAWTVVGQMHLVAGDLEVAYQAAQRGLALDTQSPAPVWLGLELMAQRHPQSEALVVGAIDRLRQPELRIGLARVLIEQLRLDDAARQLALLTGEHPGFQPGWLLWGSVLAEKGDAAAAQTAWLRYLEQSDPQDSKQQRELAQVYLGLAQIASKRGDDAAAEQWLSRISDPRSLVRAQVQRAGILARKGQLEQARQLIRELPGRNPEELRTRLMAEVQLLRDAQQLTAAHELLARALVDQPQDAELLYEQAMLAEKLGRLDEMEQHLRAIIARDPNHYHAHNALGYSLADRGIRLQEARELIVKALNQVPDDPFIADSLGWVEFRLGRLTEALAILERAYRTRADAEIAAHLGEVMWALGQREKALQVWREGLRASPDNATLRDTLKRLQVSP